MNPIGHLPDGALDIVGDVHGELAALQSLLGLLGYDRDGGHPQGRRLVFVGDLCDRGPDSPGVFALVRRMMQRSGTLCLLGNHELNVLRQEHKQGNGWAWPEARDHDLRAGLFADSRRLPAAELPSLLEFLRGLPLALERADLRIVHACWDPWAIAQLRQAGGDVLERYRAAETELIYDPEYRMLEEQAEDEAPAFEALAADPARQPPPAPLLARCNQKYQNSNPVRLLASGPEEPTPRPFFAAGKWRLLERQCWWEDYADAVPVVFGHYWRTPAGMPRPPSNGIENLFAGYADDCWLGRRGLAYCVDFSVGMRFIERRRGATENHDSRLAALRWPEAELVMDDGRRLQTRPGAVLQSASL